MRETILIVAICLSACAPSPTEEASAPRHPPLSKAVGPLVIPARAYFKAITDDDRDRIAEYLHARFDPEILEERGLEGWTDLHLNVARQVGPFSERVVVEGSAERLEVLTRLADESDWLSWTFLAADGDKSLLRGVRVVNAASPDVWAPVFENASADTLAEELHRRLGLPAVGVAIARAGGRVNSSVTGTRRQDGTAAAAVADLFHLGSCTKSVTALLVHTLVEEGLVSWSDTVGELLGDDFEINPNYRDVPLSEVARHRSGLAGHSKDIALAIERYGNLPGTAREQREAYLREVLAQPAEAEPGRTHYSNAGFALLAQVCERLLDRPYEELVIERVLQPEGVETALFGWPATEDRPEGIWGHGLEEDRLIVFEEDTHLGAFLAPAGDLALSIEDFARIAGRWSEGSQLGELLETSPGSSYGAGVGVSTRNDLRIVGHTGSTGVYWAKFRAWPDLGVAAVVATNGPVGDLEERAVNAAFDAVIRNE